MSSNDKNYIFDIFFLFHTFFSLAAIAPEKYMYIHGKYLEAALQILPKKS